MGIPEGKESDQGIKNAFKETIPEKFPNLVKEKNHTSPGRSDLLNKLVQTFLH